MTGTWLRIVTVLVLGWVVMGCVKSGDPSAPPGPKAARAPDGSWPALPSSGFISGRSATHDDLKAGNAVFVAEDGGEPIGKPLDIAVPQYAIFVDEANHRRTRVIIVQAEEARDTKLLGYHEIDTGAFGVGTFPEFELLGRSVKAE